MRTLKMALFALSLVFLTTTVTDAADSMQRSLTPKCSVSGLVGGIQLDTDERFELRFSERLTTEAGTDVYTSGAFFGFGYQVSVGNADLVEEAQNKVQKIRIVFGGDKPNGDYFDFRYTSLEPTFSVNLAPMVSAFSGEDESAFMGEVEVSCIPGKAK